MSVSTWHYGVIARYWSEFNTSGPEIGFFQRFVAAGQPALDIACGTGRLLVPYRRAGLDVDGCDVSADMIALCRQALGREGLQANLYVQPMHLLATERRFRTVFICGGFGLGAAREQDGEALLRIRDCLEPGGLLVFDVEMPYADARQWQLWLKANRAALPEPWRESAPRRTASDGTDYELRVRTVELDPVVQRLSLEMWARQWRGDQLLADEKNVLTANLYFRPELELLLQQAGFSEIEVQGHYTGRPATPEDDFLVFIARNNA